MGPSKHMRFWDGKNLKSLVRVHQITWGFGSIKTHEVLTGEKIDFGPSNHMRFLGPSNHMRWWKMGKIWLGPSNHMSAWIWVDLKIYRQTISIYNIYLWHFKNRNIFNLISLVAFLWLSNSLLEKTRGIFWYVFFYHGSLHNVTEVSDTNKIPHWKKRRDNFW